MEQMKENLSFWDHIYISWGSKKENKDYDNTTYWHEKQVKWDKVQLLGSILSAQSSIPSLKKTSSKNKLQGSIKLKKIKTRKSVKIDTL